MDEMNAAGDIAVLEIHGGIDNDGAELVFDFNGQRMSVSVFPSSSANTEGQDSIQDRTITLLNRAIVEEGDDEHEELMDQLIDTSGKATLTPIAPDEAYTVSGVEREYVSAEEDELDIDATLPSYLTNSILIDEVFVEGNWRIASLVTADGRAMFCKANGHGGGLVGTDVGRELECVQDIRRLLPPTHEPRIRIPQLLGYVRHFDSGRVVGFVREWVPGRLLRNIDIAAVPVQQSRKWLGQIDDTVRALHTQQIIWGDGKAASVSIDEQDDAWLIDFGGGWTDGWVDKELADTVEGDQQALIKIDEFLKVD